MLLVLREGRYSFFSFLNNRYNLFFRIGTDFDFSRGREFTLMEFRTFDSAVLQRDINDTPLPALKFHSLH